LTHAAKDFSISFSFLASYMPLAPRQELKVDGFVKSPFAALRFIFRRCDVP
jgi:hypothetical protein